MIFTCLFTANVHYWLFGELQEGLSSILTTGSVIVTHYGKYNKLIIGPKDQFILDNDEIVEDVGNTDNIEKTEDARDGKNGNVGEVEDIEDVVDKEAGSGNKRGDQEDTKVMDDGIDIGGVLKDVDVDNNGIGDGTKNQENQPAIVEDGEDSDDGVSIAINFAVVDPEYYNNRYITIEDREDSDNGVTIVVNSAMVDPTDRVLTNILAHPFGSLSSYSNLLPGIIAVCLSQSNDNNFKFLFISMLTLLQVVT